MTIGICRHCGITPGPLLKDMTCLDVTECELRCTQAELQTAQRERDEWKAGAEAQLRATRDIELERDSEKARADAAERERDNWKAKVAGLDEALGQVMVDIYDPHPRNNTLGGYRNSLEATVEMIHEARKKTFDISEWADWWAPFEAERARKNLAAAQSRIAELEAERDAARMLHKAAAHSLQETTAFKDLVAEMEKTDRLEAALTAAQSTVEAQRTVLVECLKDLENCALDDGDPLLMKVRAALAAPPTDTNPGSEG